MYCRRLKNGKWSCTTDATPDPLTGKRRQVTRRGETKKEASARAENAAKELSRARQKEKRYVKEVYNEWLKVYKETVKSPSVKAREASLIRFIEKHGKHYLSELETRDLQEFLIEERDLGLAKNTLVGVRIAMSLLFDHAKRNGYIDENIVKDTTLPKSIKREQAVKRKYLEKDEVQLFLTGLKALNRRNVYELAFTMLSTGMRIGEALALTWNDIDMDESVISINKTMNEKSESVSGFEFSDTKTTDSERRVSFNNKLAELFKKMKVQYNKDKLIGLRDKDSEWCDLVFVGVKQQPLRTANTTNSFNDVFRAYNIEGVSGSHVLRHTHITMLVESKVDLPVIIERVGHADARTTLDIYTHVTKKMKQRTDEKINDYFQGFI